MTACYTPQHIANYFLDRADKESDRLTPMKLIKLVYIAYGWHRALADEQLFDEPIQAWEHGPVIPSVYHEFKHFGKRYITDLATNFDLDSGDLIEPMVPESDARTLMILDFVWAFYRRFDAWSLRNKTHESGSPWSQAYKKDERGTVIDDDKIASYFKQRIGRYLDAATEYAAAEQQPELGRST